MPGDAKIESVQLARDTGLTRRCSVSLTTQQRNAQLLAKLFGQLIVEARANDVAVRKTRIGSDAELNAIHVFVGRSHPALGHAFLDWCQHRARHIDGASPNGVHIYSARRTQVRSNGTVEVL